MPTLGGLGGMLPKKLRNECSEIESGHKNTFQSATSTKNLDYEKVI